MILISASLTSRVCVLILLPDFIHCSQLTFYVSIQAGKLAAIAPSKEKNVDMMAIIPGMPSSAKGHTKLEKRSELMPIHHLLPLPVHRLSKSPRHGGQLQRMCGARRGSIRSWGTCRHIPPNHAIVSRFPGLDVNAWVVRANPHPSKAESICTVQDPLPLLIHHARWGGEGPNPPIIHSDRSRKRAFPRIHGGTSMSWLVLFF